MDEIDSGAASAAHASGGSASSRDLAEYIHQMSGELSDLAHSSGLTRVAAGLRVISALCEVELAELGQS